MWDRDPQCATLLLMIMNKITYSIDREVKKFFKIEFLSLPANESALEYAMNNSLKNSPLFDIRVYKDIRRLSEKNMRQNSYDKIMTQADRESLMQCPLPIDG